MSTIILKEKSEGSILTPESGKATVFLSDGDGKIKIKKSNGSIVSLDDALSPEGIEQIISHTDVHFAGPPSHSTYSFTQSSTETPSTAYSVYLQFDGSNTYDYVRLQFDGVDGTFDLKRQDGTDIGSNNLKAGGIYQVIYDGSKFQIISSIDTATSQEVTHATMVTMISGSQLVTGKRYTISDFETSYVSSGSYVTSGVTEKLTVEAVAANKLSIRATSIDYPDDVILYNFDETNHPKGKIIYRKDPAKGLESNCDWRQAKFKRGTDPISSQQVIADPKDSNFATGTLIFMFDDSSDGGTCRNISNIVTSWDTNDTTYTDNNLQDANNTFEKCSNITIRGKSFMNSFHQDDSSGQTPVNGNELTLENCSLNTFINQRKSVYKNVETSYFRGPTSGSGQSFVNLSTGNEVINSSDVLSGVNNTLMSNVHMFNCQNVVVDALTSSYMSNALNCGFSGCDNMNVTESTGITAFMCTDSKIYNCSNVNLFRSSYLDISLSSNLVLDGWSNSIIKNMKGAQRGSKHIWGVQSVEATSAYQTILVNATGYSAFSQGDIIEVNLGGNSINNNLPIQISFDTNSDGSPNLGPQVVKSPGNNKRYFVKGTKIYLLYEAGSTSWVILQNDVGKALYWPLQVNKVGEAKSGLVFDGNQSNIAEYVDHSSGQFTLSTAEGIDLYPAGIIYVDIDGDSSLVSIVDIQESLPTMKRKVMANSAQKVTLTIIKTAASSASKQNFVGTNSALQLSTDRNDHIEVIKRSASEPWTVVNEVVIF